MDKRCFVMLKLFLQHKKAESETERQTKILRIVNSVRALFSVDLRRSKAPALPTQPSKVWLSEASLIGPSSEECVCEHEADRNRGSIIKSSIGTTWRDHKWSLRHRLETQEEEVALFQPQTRHHKHPSYPSRCGSTSRIQTYIQQHWFLHQHTQRFVISLTRCW